jgi:hypothetical protein
LPANHWGCYRIPPARKSGTAYHAAPPSRLRRRRPGSVNGEKSGHYAANPVKILNGTINSSGPAPTRPSRSPAVAHASGPATRPRARPASAAAMRPGPVRQAPQKAPIRTGTSCWQPAGFRPGPGPGAGQSVAQGAAGLAREVTGAAGQPRGTGAGRAGFRSCSRTSPHEVRLRREKVHVGPIGRFTRDCATHDAALECVRNAPKRSVRMAPVTRQTRRSFSYPRSDLNRHWGPF